MPGGKGLHEPPPSACPAPAPGSKLRAWCKALRLHFRLLSWMGYTLGAVLAPGSMSPALYVIGYLAVFAMETATVLTNDYFDYPSDRVNRHFSAFSGGSRVLVEGRLGAGEILRGAVVSVALALAVAALAVAASLGAAAVSAAVIVVTLVLALGYTTPPLMLAYRGLGEPTVALVLSAGVVLWGYLLQGGSVAMPTPWASSLPLGMAVLAAILLAEIPDRDADRGAGKRTVAVTYGTHTAAVLALLAIWLAAASALLLQAQALIPELGRLRYAAVAHAALLSVLILRYRRRHQGAIRIDMLLAAALAYAVWFSLVPVVSLLLR